MQCELVYNESGVYADLGLYSVGWFARSQPAVQLVEGPWQVVTDECKVELALGSSAER